MSSLFTLLWLVTNVVMIVFIIKTIKSKEIELKKKNRKIWLISLAAAFLFLIIAVATSPTTPTDDKTETTETVEETAETTTEDDEIETLKATLKENYDITEPSKFAKGDTTGTWRINTVANSTPPTDYAVDYAKAYMSDGDIYYIVNLTLKTTNQFRLSGNILNVTTTEYVDKEEHDASMIGGGMSYGSKAYDMTTGEEISTEADETAGTVDNDELVSTVKEAIEGDVGEGEKITDVSFDGTTLTVKVDMTGADTSILTASEIAESRIGSITDDILALDDA